MSREVHQYSQDDGCAQSPPPCITASRWVGLDGLRKASVDESKDFAYIGRNDVLYEQC